MNFPMIDPVRGNILDPLVGAVSRSKIFDRKPYMSVYKKMAESYLPFLRIDILVANAIYIPVSGISTIYHLANSIISKLNQNHFGALRSFSDAIDHGIVFVNLTLNICTLGILNATILKTERAFANTTLIYLSDDAGASDYDPDLVRDTNLDYLAKMRYWNNFSFRQFCNPARLNPPYWRIASEARIQEMFRRNTVHDPQYAAENQREIEASIRRANI